MSAPPILDRRTLCKKIPTLKHSSLSLYPKVCANLIVGGFFRPHTAGQLTVICSQVIGRKTELGRKEYGLAGIFAPRTARIQRIIEMTMQFE